MIHVTSWNTGRFYSEKGQRIYAAWEDDICYFIDIDRCVSGQLEMTEEDAVKYMRDKVMRTYDGNYYDVIDWQKEKVLAQIIKEKED